MSAWLLGLGMGASYLMLKKANMQQTLLDEAQTKFNSSAKPETVGPTSDAIRDIQGTVPNATRFENMSTKIPTTERLALEGAQKAQAASVSEFENAARLPEIQGVYFVQGHGF